MRIAVIHNPTAGGRRRRRYAAVLESLRRAGCTVEEWPTGRRGDAESFARELKAGACDRLVAAGGDGTINEVVNGLLANSAGGRTVPLAVLPLGTANVLAREIGLPGRASALAAAIREGVSRPVAVGRVNGRCFLLMAGIGFDAHVVAGVAGSGGGLKRRLGKGAYLIESLRQFRRYPFPRYRVRLDGEAQEAASVIVANTRHYGGAFVIAPGGDLEIPVFEVCLLLRGGRWPALRYAGALVLGRLPYLADVRRVEARRVTVEGPAGDPVQADGDILAALPAEISILPDALNLVFPG